MHSCESRYAKPLDILGMAYIVGYVSLVDEANDTGGSRKVSASKNKVWPPPGGEGGYVGLTFHPWEPSSPVEAAESSFFSGGCGPDAEGRPDSVIVHTDQGFVMEGLRADHYRDRAPLDWYLGRCLSKGAPRYLRSSTAQLRCGRITTGITGLWLPSVHSDVAF